MAKVKEVPVIVAVPFVLGMLAAVKGAQFARFTYRAKGTGELAKHTLILNFSTSAVYEKDIATLEALRPTLTNPLEIQACTEILDSLIQSQFVGIGNNDGYTNADTYVHVDGLPGVKIHKETGAVHVMGMSQAKEVIEAGEYKTVKSAPLTLAKKAIDKGLRRSHIRQFALEGLSGAAIAGEVAEFTHARGN